MVGPRTAIELAEAGKRLLFNRVQINSERPPFAFDEDWGMRIGDSHDARMRNALVRGVNREIAFSRLKDLAVVVVCQDRSNVLVANAELPGRENPSMAIAGGIWLGQADHLPQVPGDSMQKLDALSRSAMHFEVKQADRLSRVG